MKTLDTLASLEGRALLREIYRELRFDQQLSSLTTIASCWRICAHESELNRYVKHDIRVLHPLGAFRGTSLWMQEIINRYYFSSINSFVYFGAAILLLVIGIRRFTDSVSDTLVIGSIVLEAMLLVFMFLVMFFSPADDSDPEMNENAEESEARQLVREIGEISRDYAVVSVQLENIASSLQELVARQDELIGGVKEIADSTSQAISPSPRIIDQIQQTNMALESFNRNLRVFSDAADTLRREEIEQAVRRELEKLLSNQIPGTRSGNGTT